MAIFTLRRRVAFLLLSTSLAALGCGRDDDGDDDDDGGELGPSGLGPGSGDALDAKRMPVMVIDVGFDPSVDALERKVAATYTIACDSAAASAGRAVRRATFEEDRDALLESLSRADDSCFIKDGIKPRIGSSLDEVAGLRDDWNTLIKTKALSKPESIQGMSDDEFYRLLASITGQRDNLIYHGTETASLIGYKNRRVDLVLVHADIGYGDEYEEVECPTLADLDREVALLKDEDVRRAYIDRPRSSEESDLAAIIKEHKIRLVNESFGTISRAGMEAMLEEGGCEPLDMREYFQITGELNQARLAKLRAEEEEDETLANYIVVQAAGNEGVAIDSVADGFDCAYRHARHLLVGATNADGEISNFSNSGACVDSYALGEGVVTNSARNFLMVEDGTSFSAPLLVRHLSMKNPLNADAETIVGSIKPALDDKLVVDPDHFPPEVMWERVDVELDGYWLTKPRARVAIENPARRHLARKPRTLRELTLMPHRRAL